MGRVWSKPKVPKNPQDGTRKSRVVSKGHPNGLGVIKNIPWGGGQNPPPLPSGIGIINNLDKGLSSCAIFWT